MKNYYNYQFEIYDLKYSELFLFLQYIVINICDLYRLMYYVDNIILYFFYTLIL